jgi:hypothetical protein
MSKLLCWLGLHKGRQCHCATCRIEWAGGWRTMVCARCDIAWREWSTR